MAVVTSRALLPRALGGRLRPPTRVAHSAARAPPSTLAPRTRAVYCRAASAAAAAPPPSPILPGGVGLKSGALSVGVGLALKLLVPCPAGLEEPAWNLFCIFASTIAGVVLKPLPMSAWSFLGATAAVATGGCTFPEAFRAFSNEAMWLVILSFFFAKGVENTGLGARLASHFVRGLGRSSLGLAYGLVAAETALAPAMPSSAARAGAVFAPVIKSVSAAQYSTAETDESRRRLGRFLVMTQLQCSVASSSLFLTGAAQSFLCLRLASEMGVVVAGAPFVAWLKGASIPALASLALTPLALFWAMPPGLRSTPEAPVAAQRRLDEMGPMSQKEATMAVVLGLTLAGWVGGYAVGVSPTCAAMLGLSALMVTGCLTWAECLDNRSAWDTLMWFAVLLGMAAQLTTVGVIPYVADRVGEALTTSLGGGWPAAFAALHAAYFLLHYIFASQTAHVGALYTAFLAMMVGAGVPGQLAALTLAYGSALNAAMTHYASGQAAVYVASGFVTSGEVFKVGAAVGALNFGIWGTLGMLWWKVLGLW